MQEEGRPALPFPQRKWAKILKGRVRERKKERDGAESLAGRE